MVFRLLCGEEKELEKQGLAFQGRYLQLRSKVLGGGSWWMPSYRITTKGQDVARHFCAPAIHGRYYFALGERVLGPYRSRSLAACVASRALVIRNGGTFRLLRYTMLPHVWGIERSLSGEKAWDREQAIFYYMDEMYEQDLTHIYNGGGSSFLRFMDFQGAYYRDHRRDYECEEDFQAGIRLDLDLSPEEAEKHGIAARSPGELKKLAQKSFADYKEFGLHHD